MLKFNYALNLGLATLLVVPAVTLGSGGEDSLEATLQRTLKALDQLAAVEERLQNGDATAIPTVLAATEAPLPAPAEDPGARDALLESLRHDVARLQSEAEQLESRPASAALPSSAPTTNTAAESSAATTTTEVPAATTGLDDALRAQLARSVGAAAAPTSTPAVTTPVAAAPSRASNARAFEPAGYAADALRLGRACYRQGRYAEALAAFEQRLEDVECAYWRARTLEKLGRDTEALAGYSAVIARKDAGTHAERAREDLEFLQWRVDFEQRSKPAEKRP
jgi:tetratricopeptide (TPR) repeat protein